MKIFTLIFISIFIFTAFLSFYGDVNAQSKNIEIGDPNVQRECPYNARGGILYPLGQFFGQGASIDDTKATWSPDVGCTCQINHCRLSTATNLFGTQNPEGITANLQFICLPANTGARLSGTTYGGVNVGDFSDKKYWQSQAGQQGVNDSDRSEVYYLDIFSADTTKQVIPQGATCKTAITGTGSDREVAYWFYPGYFDVMQGKSPSESTGNTLVGGACASGTQILFSDKDLFGNNVSGTETLFGCLPNSFNGLVAFVVRLVAGLSIVITFIIVLINLVLIIANSTSPDAVAEYQKKMFAGIFTLIGILLTITILSIFGLQIIGFGSEGLGGSIFRLFVGG